MVTTCVTNGCAMAGKIKNFVDRNGRYFARLVVPKDLRGIIGKSELRTAMGGDYREAVKRLPGAVALLQLEIGQAERKAGQGQPRKTPARYPLAPDQIAHSHYMQQLARDEELRAYWFYATFGYPDESKVEGLERAKAGSATNAELVELVGKQVERFRAAGNLDAEIGSPEWREIARALCVAEFEAMERSLERNEGDYTGMPVSPILLNAQPPDEPRKRVSLSRLWDEYVSARKQAGFMKDGGRRQSSVISGFRKFLGHDDAARITKKDVLAWRDKLMKTKAAKTVSDVDLMTVRTLLRWAVENDRLPSNVAETVKQPKPRRVFSREQGYTLEEANTILAASRTYEPHADENGYVREKPNLVAAKRWVPIICAFTGARVSEITQLRKEDIRQVDGHWIARITPDAGAVKSGGFRDVPLHRQIIEQGFAEFLSNAPSGPLFHNGSDKSKFVQKSKQASNQIADWLRNSGLRPEGMQPSHAWRHRLKTQCRELALSDRVVDAIQGHSGKSASDNYGDVTLKTMIDAIDQLPQYDLD
jgi:integrase